MNTLRMTLGQFFRKQHAGEIEIETEVSTEDPAAPETETAPAAEEPETPEPATPETVADPATPEAATDPKNPETVIPEAAESADSSASVEGASNLQALVESFTKELNLFGATPEARAAFHSEAGRNKSFVDALKNVGIVSDEDATTTAQQGQGARSYEKASWNKAAIEKRGK